MNRKHSNSNFAPVIPMSQEKCQRFHLVHPFTCMVAWMTGSGKTVWVQSITTNSNRDRSTTGENNLVLCSVETCLHAIIDDDTNNRICQGIPESMENDSSLDVKNAT